MALDLQHANHAGIEFAVAGSELRATVTGGSAMLEAVAGGAGFIEVGAGSTVGAAVELDLDDGRVFNQKMVGNITGLTFANVPAHGQHSAVWTWVLWIDAIGDYTLEGTPTVRWLNGGSWDSLVFVAGDTNIVQFMRVGTVTYASLVRGGDSTPLDPYKVCFLQNSIVVIMTEDEDIDVANDSQNGDGTITYARNGSAITTRTTFYAGDRLTVTCASQTGTTTVRIPRYLTFTP